MVNDYNRQSELIQEDFDRIALLPTGGWDHNGHYHKYLLRHIPAVCNCALDTGCGTGGFTRLLAKRADKVIGLDLSPNMINIAKDRSREYDNIEYHVADVMKWDFPEQQFDCIASIAALHHLPFEEILSKMKEALKTGGVLLVLDLYKQQGIGDISTNALAIPMNLTLNLVKNGRLRASRNSRAVWYEHGRRDHCLTLRYIRRICDSILPGVVVRRHILWRYSLIWNKPN